ncbi:MAG: histidine-type phosphatase [Pseudomonadales bacterium]
MAAAGFATTGHYTTKTPYVPPSERAALPPQGFRPLMVQLVARHGSRPLSSADDDDLSLQVWRQAQAEGALTPLGAALGSVLEDVRAVHERLGYGAISQRGVEEQEALAARLLYRQPELFEQAVADRRRISVQHSGRERAEQSALAFVRGLERGLPALAPLIDPPRPAPGLVYFNDAAETPAARNYRRYRREDARLLATLTRLHELPQTHAMARRLLEALYAPAFIDGLEAGNYRFEAAADPDDTIGSALEAAASLYALYGISSNLDREADWRFGRFIEPEAAAWFAMIDDAETFYERGPGFADEDVTWRAAEVLLEDVLSGVEAVATGVSDEVAVLRFTHAQALIPFAALLGIDGASEGLPDTVLYSYAVSPWRTSRVSPMAANVQWDVYVDEGGTVLVRMLHHERPARFAAGCRAWQDGSDFYRLDELRRCYGLPRVRLSLKINRPVTLPSSAGLNMGET